MATTIIDITATLTPGLEPMQVTTLLSNMMLLADESDVPIGTGQRTISYALNTVEEDVVGLGTTRGMYENALYPAQRLPSAGNYSKLGTLTYLGIESTITDGTDTELIISRDLEEAYREFVILHPTSNKETITVNGYLVSDKGTSVVLV